MYFIFRHLTWGDGKRSLHKLVIHTRPAIPRVGASVPITSDLIEAVTLKKGTTSFSSKFRAYKTINRVVSFRVLLNTPAPWIYNNFPIHP